MKNFFLLSFLLSVCFSGCQWQKENTTQPPSQEEKVSQKLDIVASFYPLAFFAEEIAGEKAEVVDLAGNTEVHDFTPSPRDIAKLNNADLVIFQGIGLEPWAEDMIPQLEKKGVATREVSHDIDLHKMEEEEDHDEHEEEEEGHHHGEFDPHTWLDPVLAQSMVNSILNEIISIDPKNTEYYTQNAKKLTKKLHDFDVKFQNLSCKNKEVIISHDAFGYLERRYHFILLPIAGISPHDEPSAKLLAKLKKKSEEEGISYVLVEETNVKRFAKTLARETGLNMLTVYTLETNSEPFFSAYEKNLNALKIALQCQ